MGNLFKNIGNLFSGGGSGGGSSGGGGSPAAKKLFTPEQVSKVTKDYTTQGGAKWNQIFANMQSAGGTGGPDLTGAIENQAKSLGSQLGELTDQSGYGSDGQGQLQQILKSLEGGIGPKYPVY